MKILFIISSLRPGGAERQLAELAMGLDKSIHDVTVVTTEHVQAGYRDSVEQSGIEVLCCERRNKFDLRPLFQIARLVRTRNIDVIHSFLLLPSVFGLLVSKATRTPLVASALRTTVPAGKLDVLMGKVLAAGATYLVSNSRAAFDARFTAWKDNFAVVYNGMDLSRFDPPGDTLEPLKRSLDYRSDHRYVAMVASLSRKKDQETLLAAAALVVNEIPQARFVFVGEDLDGKEAALRARAHELGISDTVMFTGYSAQSDQMMWLFDVVVLLTHPDYQEGCPNALLEAMAVGKPVLASSGGGTSEVIRDGQTGMLVAPGDHQATADKLVALLGNDEMRATLAESGRRYVTEHFSIATYVANYERLYKSAVS